MILKWIDHSNATHLIDGIASTISYGQRHISEAQALAEHYDGVDGVVYRMIGPDVYREQLADAVKRGHSFQVHAVETNEDTGNHFVDEPEDAPMCHTSVIGHTDRAVRFDGIDPGSVTTIRVADRSFGLYVIVSYADRRSREHLFIDTDTAYLMSDQGVTVDRLSGDR